MKTVLVTGSSSGIGYAICQALAEKGWNVLAGVRRPEALAPLVSAFPDRVRPLRLDVTSQNDIEDAASVVSELPQGLHALVNNAGTNLNGAFEHTDLDDARRLFDLNFWGAVALTQRMLPHVRRAAQPRDTAKLVFVGSIGSLAAVPWEAFYHGSKFALYGWAESLRYELRSQHICVSVACPGGVKTEFLARTRESVDAALQRIPENAPEAYRRGVLQLVSLTDLAAERSSSPERIAQSIRKIVEQPGPKFRQVLANDAKMIYRLKPLLPQESFHGLYQRLFARF